MKDKSLEAELYRCKKHIQKLVEAQERYRREAEKKTRELEQARRILEQTFNALEVGILVLDKDMRIVMLNESLKRLFEVEEKNVEGKHCWQVLQKREAPCSGEKCLRVLRGADKLEEELIFLRGGRKRIYMVRTYPWTVDGKILGIIRTFVDITDRRLAEEYGILSGVSMYMAHVVKNSITPIGGLVNRIMNICNSEDVIRISKYIFSSVMKLERSVFEYESYVKIKRKPPYEIFNASEVLKEIEDFISTGKFVEKFYLQDLKEDFDIEFSIDYRSAPVLGNRSMFFEAFLHLLATLISYGVESEGKRVKMQVFSRVEDSFFLQVKYNYAISERILEFAFEPWKTEKGVGFDRWGIAIFKEMSNFHGAKMAFKDGGSSVVFESELSSFSI